MNWYKFLNRISLLLHALGSAVVYFLVEVISRHSFYETWNYMIEKPLVFAYNTAFIFTTSLIVYLFRRRCFWRIAVAVFWIFLGVVNGVLLMNRVTPFTGPDLTMLTDAMAMAKKYLPEWGVVVACVVVAVLAVFLAWMFLKGPKYRGKIKYYINVPLVLVGVLAFAGLTQLALEKRVLSNYFGNIAFAYEDYGYPYCLATTIFNTGISCPRDYSQEEIDRIERTESDLPETVEGDYPNIIFLQLESFFDPTLVNYLELSEDPIPTFRKLMEEYSSGYFKVPSVGAGTANTEFETITGMSMHYFGPGEYPYKSILKETTCESAPYVLKELGYTAHAVHNHEANFYGRRTVFPNLGFDYFVSEEYMAEEDQKTPLDWVKDSILTDEILKCLDATEGQDYIYTISVQGHGAYPTEPILEDPEITVSGSPTQEKNYQWEYYVNQIHEMDNFIKELVEALSEYPEDVVLVMYGDHLPTMDLTVEDLDNRYLFQTEYVIWDNFGLEKKDENLAAYQMAAEVMDRIGIHEGTIFRYHQARRNSKDYQVDLETLQYDLLYGERYAYGGETPFVRTKMKMGLYDLTLDSVELVSPVNYTYYIKGSNYTPSSQVQLNGEWYDTVYINPTTLMISGTELTDFDRLSVAQRSNSSTAKALSKSYNRSCYALFSESKWKLPAE
ncbi:MAG TPA: LTA synthase family protein [Candidatus Blautia faecavium]|uniref:LTA synthase family protein n=1 Tax=Candidatus Blautia faecavium TaxID=2838487 RepID=A0A9D2RWG4_9FIRM|nr:LTA synthase family protein [Candidatus Blautia faecavium]